MVKLNYNGGITDAWRGCMTDAEKTPPKQGEGKPVTLPCGCVYQDDGWMLTRIKECEFHHRKRMTKRPYRAKAECVRP